MPGLSGKKKLKALEEKIERFLGFFSRRVEEIGNLSGGESTQIFMKILYTNVLDALSKTTSHKKKKNRDRIVDFISNFCDWTNCEKISLSHLIRLLDRVPDPSFSDLREYAFSIIATWDEGKEITLDKDPNFQEVKKRWPRDNSMPFEEIQIGFLQHKNLFYRYRNSIIHEFREPGDGIELSHNLEPFYDFSRNISTNQSTWELVYPLGFYKRLCENATKKLKDYYLKNQIQPYSHYPSGTYWIERLNL